MKPFLIKSTSLATKPTTTTTTTTTTTPEPDYHYDEEVDQEEEIVPPPKEDYDEDAPSSPNELKQLLQLIEDLGMYIFIKYQRKNDMIHINFWY